VATLGDVQDHPPASATITCGLVAARPIFVHKCIWPPLQSSVLDCGRCPRRVRWTEWSRTASQRRVDRGVATLLSSNTVWGDAPPRGTRRTLHAHLTRVRRLLERDAPDRPAGVPARRLPSGHRSAGRGPALVPVTRGRRAVGHAMLVRRLPKVFGEVGPASSDVFNSASRGVVGVATGHGSTRAPSLALLI